ncbi:MAG: anti-sigma factor [Rhodocyclales bacterium]|nr:anti-sigma factor [Rhodocyclales bacterium]
MNYDRPELLDRLAAAYVVGTLGSRARRRFARLCRTLPAASAAVRQWEARLSPLAASVPPVAPSPRVWENVARRLGHGDVVVSRRRRWWQPTLAFAFGVLATVGVLRLYPELTPGRPAPQQAQLQALPASYVGLLLDAAGQPAALASTTRHGRRMDLKILQPVALPAGKVLQLWALPTDGAPFPLGVVPAQGKGSFEMADTAEALLSRVTRLAVSVEDAPRTAGATPAPFVLSGHCVKLW